MMVTFEWQNDTIPYNLRIRYIAMNQYTKQPAEDLYQKRGATAYALNHTEDGLCVCSTAPRRRAGYQLAYHNRLLGIQQRADQAVPT